MSVSMTKSTDIVAAHRFHLSRTDGVVRIDVQQRTDGTAWIVMGEGDRRRELRAGQSYADTLTALEIIEGGAIVRDEKLV